MKKILLIFGLALLLLPLVFAGCGECGAIFALWHTEEEVTPLTLNWATIALAGIVIYLVMKKRKKKK